MSVATAKRPAAHPPRTTPIGTGDLHRALEDARDLAQLHAFCCAHVCTTGQVSADGKRLNMLMVFDLMRLHGYAITQPAKAPRQPRRNSTMWTVTVTLPNKTTVQLAFATPDAA